MIQLEDILASAIEGLADGAHEVEGVLYARSPNPVPERRKEIRVRQVDEGDNGDRINSSEHRQSRDEIEAGGVGSGCNPEVADHCGPLPKVPQHITSIKLKT